MMKQRQYIGYILWDKPLESLIGLSLVIVGLLGYLIDQPKSKNPDELNKV